MKAHLHEILPAANAYQEPFCVTELRAAKSEIQSGGSHYVEN